LALYKFCTYLLTYLDQPDGRLNLTANATPLTSWINTSCPGCRGYCYTELAIFLPNSGRNYRQYSLRLTTEGWPSWVGLGGWLRSQFTCPKAVTHPSTIRAQCRATTLIETNALPLHLLM